VYALPIGEHVQDLIAFWLIEARGPVRRPGLLRGEVSVELVNDPRLAPSGWCGKQDKLRSGTFAYLAKVVEQSFD
jgi:hypothetical protein